MNSLPHATRLGSCVLLAAFAGLPLSAAAGHDGSRLYPSFYVGGGVGYDKLENENFNRNGGEHGVEDERMTYKGLVGLHLNRGLSLEAQYVDFGTAEDGNNRVDATGVSAGIVAHIPLFRHVHPYGKAGVLFWESDNRFNGLSRNDDGNDFTYGAGARFAVAERVDVRAEYERFELDDTDVDHLSATVQFNF